MPMSFVRPSAESHREPPAKTMDIATCLPNAANDGCESGKTTGKPSESCGDLHILTGCAATSTEPLTCTLIRGVNVGTVTCQ